MYEFIDSYPQIHWSAGEAEGMCHDIISECPFVSGVIRAAGNYSTGVLTV